MLAVRALEVTAVAGHSASYVNTCGGGGEFIISSILQRDSAARDCRHHCLVICAVIHLEICGRHYKIASTIIVYPTSRPIMIYAEI